ncbi:flagellin [Rhodovulum sulfidophilum]|uniref:Flagellin n=2 Tax=Rhodovulum sulfidophilum TaxID=35806 RepID=A0ABS1RZV4_RHOSU|nr:flagellin [Rhodovulum sulfidophilum]MBL3610464.1 flagellin [Rhodovulum sulfidophilum]
MSSILTNSSAMVALQTLKGINSSLEKTQSEISTGKSVGSAKDNSAVWAISKVMESDVSGFDAVSDSLATGQAMIGVARTATETVTDLLKDIKTKVVAARDATSDTTKLQNETDELISLVESTIGAAQFNGVNLIDSGTGTSVVGSIDRSGGTVTANSITIDAQNLNTGAAATAAGQLAAGTTSGTNLVVVGNNNDGAVSIASGAGESFALSAVAQDETVTVTLGDQNFSYTVTADDVASGNDANEIALSNLRDLINAAGITGVTALYDPVNAAGELVVDNQGADDINMTVRVRADGAGALAGLNGFSITGGTALADIETMINSSIDAAAAFGAAESRLETQSDFLSKLTDALKTGIGALVDADMEEASARLQALQVQQQLGTQALSIANQSPQNLLSLFR